MEPNYDELMNIDDNNSDNIREPDRIRRECLIPSNYIEPLNYIQPPNLSIYQSNNLSEEEFINILEHSQCAYDIEQDEMIAKIQELSEQDYNGFDTINNHNNFNNFNGLEDIFPHMKMQLEKMIKYDNNSENIIYYEYALSIIEMYENEFITNYTITDLTEYESLMNTIDRLRVNNEEKELFKNIINTHKT